jgi:hypothetical protein
MKLFRACKQPNGRVDVLVSTPSGESWLRGYSPENRRGKLQYDWGNDTPGARMLALDILTAATARPMLAELLAEDYHAQVVVSLPAQGWAIPSWEVLTWVMSEYEALLSDMGNATNGGIVPCPSDN